MTNPTYTRADLDMAAPTNKKLSSDYDFESFLSSVISDRLFWERWRTSPTTVQDLYDEETRQCLETIRDIEYLDRKAS